MQVPHDYHLNVLDVVACTCNLLVKIHALVVVHAVKYVVYLGTDDFRVVIACACFKENKAFCGVLDQACYHDEFTPFVSWVVVGSEGCISLLCVILEKDRCL